jgi:hypothetical protein
MRRCKDEREYSNDENNCSSRTCRRYPRRACYVPPKLLGAASVFCRFAADAAVLAAAAGSVVYYPSLRNPAGSPVYRRHPSTP